MWWLLQHRPPSEQVRPALAGVTCTARSCWHNACTCAPAWWPGGCSLHAARHLVASGRAHGAASMSCMPHRPNQGPRCAVLLRLSMHDKILACGSRPAAEQPLQPAMQHIRSSCPALHTQ